MTPVQSFNTDVACDTNHLNAPSEEETPAENSSKLNESSQTVSILAMLLREKSEMKIDPIHTRPSHTVHQTGDPDLKDAITMATKLKPAPEGLELLFEQPKIKNSDPTRTIVTDAVPEEFTQTGLTARAFDIICGRFGLNSHQPHYIVTPEEMRRRIEGPESLNSSNLALNLKRSKLKNGGELMRHQLKEHGIDVFLNNRQKAIPNRVIALVEAEAIHLGLDLETTVKEDYPIDEIGEEVFNEIKKENDQEDKSEVMDAMSNMEDFLECMTAMESVFTSVVPPISGIVPVASKNKSLNRKMEKYSCATHGFGIVSQRVWVREMKKIGEELVKRMNDV